MLQHYMLCLVLLLSFSTLKAKEDHQVGLKLGLTSIDNEDGWNFKKSSFFIDLTLDTHTVIKPRVDLGYINVDEEDKGSVDSLFQFTVNGIYDIDLSAYNTLATPYLLGGLGYEHVSDEIPNFKSHPFFQVGFGMKYPLINNITLLSEFRALKILGDGDDNEDNEFALMFGINIPLFVDVIRTDVSQAPAPEIVHNIEPAFLDSDNDGIEDAIDKCPHTPEGEQIDNNGCMTANAIVIPEEVTYVEDDIQRPTVVTTTPVFPSFAKSKPKISRAVKPDRQNLKVNFESSSATILTASKPNIKEFANYLKSNTKNKVTIEGYTDNSGIRSKNFTLSTKRAQAVRALLIEYGIKASRIKAVGKGDLNPIADNETENGRAENRRIEAVMHH